MDQEPGRFTNMVQDAITHRSLEPGGGRHEGANPGVIYGDVPAAQRGGGSPNWQQGLSSVAASKSLNHLQGAQRTSVNISRKLESRRAVKKVLIHTPSSDASRNGGPDNNGSQGPSTEIQQADSKYQTLDAYGASQMYGGGELDRAEIAKRQRKRLKRPILLSKHVEEKALVK